MLKYFKRAYSDGNGHYYRIMPIILRRPFISAGANSPVMFRGSIVLRIDSQSIFNRPSRWHVGWIETV